MTTKTSNLGLKLINFNIVPWHDDTNDNWRILDAAVSIATGISGLEGSWENGIDVLIGQKYLDVETLTAWEVLVSHTTPQTGTFEDARTAEPTYWEGMGTGLRFRGAWTTATVYVAGDLAYDSGDQLYCVCLVGHTSTTSMRDDIVNWGVIADGGSVYTETEIDALFAYYIAQTTEGNFWTAAGVPPKIYRMRDRVFIGDAVGMGPTRINTNTTWVPDAATGANWAPRDSQFIVMSDNGAMAVTGMSLASQGDLIAYRPATIGVSGFVINDGAYDAGILNNYPVAWALYGDVQHEPTDGTGNSYGLELAVKNKNTNDAAHPYDRKSGAYGLWLHGGGDPVYGGAATFPSNAGIMFVRNNASGLSAGWNVGINFDDESLTYDGNNLAPAIRMAKGHCIEWWAPEGTKGAFITSAVDDDANQVQQLFNDNTVAFIGVNGKNMVQFNHAASAVNYVSITNAATGGGPSIAAAGDDTNVLIAFAPKGTSSGFLNAGSGSARMRWNNTGIGFFATGPVAQKTGWAVDTGTDKRTANVTYSGTAEVTYTQATIQTLMNSVRDLSQTIKSLKDDLHATAGYGLLAA